jgi:hypothetical protein
LVGLGSPFEGKGNDILTAATAIVEDDDLNYCLDILKIKENKHDEDYDNGEIETKIKKLLLLYAQKNIAFFSIYHKRLISLKIIADFVTLTSNTLTRSQLYDFLMLSTTATATTTTTTTKNNDIVFKIYGDLMENYETASDILKLNYPRIIVDVIAVLNNGIDMSGKQVSVYRVHDYYLSRKSEPLDDNVAGLDISNITLDGKDRYKTEYDEDSDDFRNNNSNNALVQSLVRITGRNGKEIEESLARLNNSDIERIRNLCVNYPKIDKYCRLIATDKKHFIDEIERERGNVGRKKKLTKYQLQIAIISIRKVRKYIENVLDKKFVPHSSHYINHTKHNLEYGYQVMGLIESSNKRRVREGGEGDERKK